jgi:hypothetical protein
MRRKDSISFFELLYPRLTYIRSVSSFEKSLADRYAGYYLVNGRLKSFEPQPEGGYYPRIGVPVYIKQVRVVLLLFHN